TTPTALERAGDFSQTFDLDGKVIPVVDPTNAQAVPNNRIPASRIDPNGQALLKIFPLPNFFDRSISAGRYNYVFQSETKTPQRLETLKVDYHVLANNQITFSLIRHRDEQTGAQGLATGSSNWPQISRSFITQGTVLSIRDQFIVNPTLVNEFTL